LQGWSVTLFSPINPSVHIEANFHRIQIYINYTFKEFLYIILRLLNNNMSGI